MYVTKRFLAGLALATVIGLLAAAAQASVSREYDETPITVPSGLVGDQVTYATFEKGRVEITPQRWPVVYSGLGLPIAKAQSGSSAPPPTSRAASDEWSAPVLAGSRIGPVKPVIDATGMVHDAIPIHSNGTGRAGQTILEYVDLGTRLAIRSEWKTPLAGSVVVSANFEPHSPELFGLQYQGRTLRLGQDVSDLYPVPDWVDAEKDEFTLRSTVDRRSLVNSIDAYGIRTEMGYRQGALDASGKAALTAIRMTVVEYTYIGPEIPYPLLVHRFVTWVAGDRAQSYEVMVSLVEYQRGSTPIPWGEDRATAHFRATNPDIERTSGSRQYPDEGTGRRLDYTLSQAIQDVNNDPTLVQFHQWQADNPKNVLAGARLTRGSSYTADSSSLSWTLVYGVPSGSYYTVRAERVRNPVTLGTSTFTTNVGPTTGQPFDAVDFPSNPVTFGAADALWYALAHSDYNTRPNYVVWGLAERYYGVSARDALRTLTFGYVGDGRSTLTLNTETGNIRSFYEERSKFDCACFTLASAKERPGIVPKTVPAGVSPPTVEAAVVTTSASLAVFLAAYFLPLLQFALFAGFAKLRKEDILDNRLRDQILHLIKAEPGIHASDIARRVEAGWGTIVYHLSVLERNKLVSSLVDGRHKRFFPVGIVDFSRRGQLGVLRNETTKTIFEMIANDPGIIQGEVAGRSGLSVPAAIWHLKRLEDAGLVGRAKEGRRVHYFANKEEDVPVPYDERDAVEIV